MGNYFRVNLDEGALEKNISDSRINFNLRRGEMNQEWLVGIGDNSRCAISKDKAREICWDMTEYWLTGTNHRIYPVMDTDVSIQIQLHPSIHHLGWLLTIDYVEDRSSATSIHIKLTTTSTTAPEKCYWITATTKTPLSKTLIIPILLIFDIISFPILIVISRWYQQNYTYLFFIIAILLNGFKVWGLFIPIHESR